MESDYLFIVIEGPDGCGKSTVANLLSTQLNGLLYQTPSGEYKTMRRSIDDRADVIEHFLFYLAAVRYASQKIKDLLQTRTVICDRYLFSTLAYHHALDVGITIDIEQLQLIIPDYIFYLQISAATQLVRLRQKGNEQTGADDWIVKQNVFTRIDEEFKKFPLRIIETESDCPEKVAEKIMSIIRKDNYYA